MGHERTHAPQQSAFYWITAQVIDHGEIPITQLTDSQLYEIAAGALPEKNKRPKALPPPRKP
jgi:hypothetical protein